MVTEQTAEPARNCALCPRLVDYRRRNAAAEPSWFNGAVPSWGDADAQLLIVGLAPGRGGANRTGRPFTGDYAGDLLYATLLKFGLAEGTYGATPDDGLRLKGTMITNAVRCAPPENKPVGAEIAACRPFLTARIAAIPKLRSIVTLGRIAHESTLRALGQRLKDHPFAHAAQSEAPGPNGPLTLAPSYHCSRYNTNTGRLTPAMFEAVFAALPH
ncbi:MAG: uracil-DNA glycosylase [Pseudomonadota bacterium]